MPREAADDALLWDMLGAEREAIGYAANETEATYLGNFLLRRATERLIEIIGEAAKGVSAATKNAHPEIPWQRIVSQRHILAHHYGRIDHGRIWRVIVEDLPV